MATTKVLITALANSQILETCGLLYNCLTTLKDSMIFAKDYTFKVNVIESASKIPHTIGGYPWVRSSNNFELEVIKYDGNEFNYNKALNQSLSACTDFDYHIVSNNDVVFDRITIDSMLKGFNLTDKVICTSPLTVLWPEHQKFEGINTHSKFVEGYKTGSTFCGWLHCMDKEYYKYFPKYDESFSFFCQDDDIVENLRRLKKDHGYKNILLLKSGKSYHAVGGSNNLINVQDQVIKGRKAFNDKYGL